MAGRRDFTRTLWTFRVGSLAVVAAAAAVVVAYVARDVHYLAAGGSVVWWDTRDATMAAILAGIGLHLLVSAILPVHHRRGVRR